MYGIDCVFVSWWNTSSSSLDNKYQICELFPHLGISQNSQQEQLYFSSFTSIWKNLWQDRYNSSHKIKCINFNLSILLLHKYKSHEAQPLNKCLVFIYMVDWYVLRSIVQLTDQWCLNIIKRDNGYALFSIYEFYLPLCIQNERHNAKRWR